MRNLKDLKLRKKTEQKVSAWLTEWLELFVKQADGKQGNIIRADFANNDFFFFTDCRDIINKDPEDKADETNLKVRGRKRKVVLQLFVKTLLGEKLGRKSPCSHCGFEDRIVKHMYNGYYVLCPKCGFLVLNGFLSTMKESADKLLLEDGMIRLVEAKK